MKKITLGFMALFFCFALLAQPPQLMSYQAVVRNSSNQLLSTAPVGMRVSILQGSTNGAAVYTEKHSSSSNAQGLVTLAIGGGTAQSGSFAGINWANGPYFLKVETDPTGGNNYSITATSQLLSVPYALHSATSVKAENGVPTGATQGQVFTFCDGVPVWTDGGLCPGKLSGFNCGASTNTGTLYKGIAATSASSTISYTGGNGGIYSAQNIPSTGVTGLTATIAAGTLASGAGTLTYTISGTPSGSGTASFALSLGGQTCTLSRNVDTLSIGTYPAGTVHCNGTPTAVVPVTNPATGKIWMDRNLGASQAATSSTDAAAYGDLYQWGRRADGHQCRNSGTTSTLSSTDQPPHGDFIVSPNSPSDWRSAQNDILWQGVLGINNPCPGGYRIPTLFELNEERESWSSNTSSGAFVSPLKMPLSGSRRMQDGSVKDIGSFATYWSSTVNGTNANYLEINSTNAYVISQNRAYGFAVRCINESQAIQGTINSIDCGASTNTGTLYKGIAATSASSTISYNGGNGGIYSAQSIPSTGVTGLTATIAASTLASGAGSLTYTISGTPSGSGTASFALSLGGQTCTLTRNVDTLSIGTYPAGTVHCNGTPTAVVPVVNPATGKIWMDRNLGASQAATSSTDAAAYGDLYQWGRRADGHQCRNSGTTSTLSSTDQPTTGSFILTANFPFDWRSPKNNNLWESALGTNNPCPLGYRIPTKQELENERLSWNANNSAGALLSPLKLPMPGLRDVYVGYLFSVGNRGTYWSSSAYTQPDRQHQAHFLDFNSGDAYLTDHYRSNGISVRCIKD